MIEMMSEIVSINAAPAAKPVILANVSGFAASNHIRYVRTLSVVFWMFFIK
jgi:hypothetical protein